METAISGVKWGGNGNGNGSPISPFPREMEMEMEMGTGNGVSPLSSQSLARETSGRRAFSRDRPRERD